MLESELFTETSAKGEGVCQKRTFADVGREGFGKMRTTAKFWGISTKFNINLDKNC